MRLELLDKDSELMSFAEEMLAEIDGVTPDSLRNNKDREVQSKVYLGYLDETPICVIETYNEFYKKLSITNFAITIDMQGCGFGRAFLSLIENEAEILGMSEVTLTSHPDSYGFYIKSGYQKHGTSELCLYKTIIV